METKTVTALAQFLLEHEAVISRRVAARQLERFPELRGVLRLEEQYTPIERMAEVAVERLNRLVRAMLLFDAPALAEPELRWARDVLERWGVTRQHTAALIDFYFSDLEQAQLEAPVRRLARQLQQFLQTQLDTIAPTPS